MNILKTGLADLRGKHAIQTVLILLLMIGLSGVLGYVLLGVLGLLIAASAGLALFLLSPRISPEAVLALYGARPVPRVRSSFLYQVADELSARAGLDVRPGLYTLNTAVPNAFTVGQVARPAIVLTRGLIERLDARELSGVLAHEIAHIRNGDLWLLALADLLRRFTRGLSLFGVFYLLLSLPVLVYEGYIPSFQLVLLLMAAPASSLFLQLALSRTREFEADQAAIQLTGDPYGLASALHRLEPPFQRAWRRMISSGRRERVFSSHPSPEERIERLISAPGL